MVSTAAELWDSNRSKSLPRPCLRKLKLLKLQFEAVWQTSSRARPSTLGEGTIAGAEKEPGGGQLSHALRWRCRTGGNRQAVSEPVPRASRRAKTERISGIFPVSCDSAQAVRKTDSEARRPGPLQPCESATVTRLLGLEIWAINGLR